MSEKYNLEKCVLDDVERTWIENNFCYNSEELCDCCDKLKLMKHILTCEGIAFQYKQAKMEQYFRLLLKNSLNKCMPCKHQWFSYSCQDYVKNVRLLLESVSL